MYTEEEIKEMRARLLKQEALLAEYRDIVTFLEGEYWSWTSPILRTEFGDYKGEFLDCVRTALHDSYDA